MAVHRDFDPDKLMQGAKQISNLMNDYQKSFTPPKLISPPKVTGNAEIVAALQKQREENSRLSAKNTRLTYLSIFLAAVPVLFGLWSQFQAQKG